MNLLAGAIGFEHLGTSAAIWWLYIFLGFCVLTVRAILEFLFGD